LRMFDLRALLTRSGGGSPLGQPGYQAAVPGIIKGTVQTFLYQLQFFIQNFHTFNLLQRYWEPRTQYLIVVIGRSNFDSLPPSKGPKNSLIFLSNLLPLRLSPYLCPKRIRWKNKGVHGAWGTRCTSGT